MTTKTINAQYNHGLIKPMENLDLNEGEMIQVIIRRKADREKQEMSDNQSGDKKKHFLEMLSQLKFTSGVTDASTNHDKYLYDNPHNL